MPLSTLSRTITTLRCCSNKNLYNSQSATDAPRELEPRRFLNALAKENRLPDLLKPEFAKKVLDMGIPRRDLEMVLAKPGNEGMAGVEAVKSLLFTASPVEQGRRVSSLPSTNIKNAPPTRQTQPQQRQHDTRNPQRSLRPEFGSQNSSQGRSQSPLSVSEGQHDQGGSKNGSDDEIAAAVKASGNRSIRSLLDQYNIHPPSYAPGTYRMLCPKCEGGSRSELSFNVTIDENGKSAVWHCFRASCEYSGAVHMDKPRMPMNPEGYFVSASNRKRKLEPPVRPSVTLEPLTEEMKEFFLSRGISLETLQRNGVSCQLTYDPVKKKEDKIIAFPYYRDGSLINIKYRTLDKRFWQVRGAEKILYGLDDISESPEVVIVEGEMDKLAFEEAGIKNVVSVPDGAPSRVRDGSLPPETEDVKYAYLWNCRAWLDDTVRIVIATDNDAPGDALAEELARRLGRERCWRVRWPVTKVDHEFVSAPVGVKFSGEQERQDISDAGSIMSPIEQGSLKNDLNLDHDANADSNGSSRSRNPVLDPTWYRKDANEVLTRDGPEKVRLFYENAEPLPIRGLLRFHEYYDEIIKHYFLELRDGQGVSTGWSVLDKYYRVVPGELTIVTGVPNSGKSEWIDALLCNLTELHGWTFALCSMEKRVTDHMRQLAEKYIGLPFFDLPYASGVNRMSQENLDVAIDWVDGRFHLIRFEDDALPSVDWVLGIAKAAVYRYGIRGLVIDPYNELDHQRPASMSETEYVSQMLTKVKRFAQTAGVHVWFVAHPRQLRDWKGQAPNLYDISGSAHFINKADNGIVIHRVKDPDDPNTRQVEVLVRKVRNKAAGMIGECRLEYERVNGRYLDLDDPNPPRTSLRVRFPRDRSKAQNWLSSTEAVTDSSLDDPVDVGFNLSSGATWVQSDGTVTNDPVDFDWRSG